MYIIQAEALYKGSAVLLCSIAAGEEIGIGIAEGIDIKKDVAVSSGDLGDLGAMTEEGKGIDLDVHFLYIEQAVAMDAPETIAQGYIFERERYIGEASENGGLHIADLQVALHFIA